MQIVSLYQKLASFHTLQLWIRHTMFKFDYLQNQSTHGKFTLGKGPFVCIFKPNQRGPLFKTMTVMLSLYPDISGKKRDKWSQNPLVCFANALPDERRLIYEVLAAQYGQGCSSELDHRGFWLCRMLVVMYFLYYVLCIFKLCRMLEEDKQRKKK